MLAAAATVAGVVQPCACVCWHAAQVAISWAAACCAFACRAGWLCASSAAGDASAAGAREAHPASHELSHSSPRTGQHCLTSWQMRHQPWRVCAVGPAALRRASQGGRRQGQARLLSEFARPGRQRGLGCWAVAVVCGLHVLARGAPPVATHARCSDAPLQHLHAAPRTRALPAACLMALAHKTAGQGLLARRAQRAGATSRRCVVVRAADEVKVGINGARAGGFAWAAGR